MMKKNTGSFFGKYHQDKVKRGNVMYKLRLGQSMNFLGGKFYETIEQAKALGFDSMDLDLCGKCAHRDEEIEGYKDLEKGLKAIKESGLYFNGVHISFGKHWNFGSHVEEQRAEAVANFSEIAPLIDRYSPFCYVIHGSSEPISDEVRPAQIAALKKSLTELTAITSTPIAVESLPRTCLFNTAKEGMEIIDGIENVYACVDVNHFLQEDSADAVKTLGSRIITTHISDHDYINERHWLPGEGKIDWQRLIGALESIGYTGVFNYEANGSLIQVKENYLQLFERYNNK